MGSLLGDMPDLGGPQRRQPVPDLGDDILAAVEGAGVEDDVGGGFSWNVDPSADAEGKKRKKGKKKSKTKDKKSSKDKRSSKDKKKKSRGKGDSTEDGERPSTAGSAGSAAAAAPAPTPAEDSYDPDLPTNLGADFFSDMGGGDSGGGFGDALSAFSDAQTAATQGRRSRAGRRSAAEGALSHTGNDDALGGATTSSSPALTEDPFEKRAREARERAAQETLEREQREKLEREQKAEREQREREQRESEQREREQREREQREREQREREQREREQREREQREREQREREQREREQRDLEDARRQREADNLRDEQRRRDELAASIGGNAGPGGTTKNELESSLDATATSDQLNESLGEELMAKMFGGTQIPVTKTGAEDAPAAGIALSAPRHETDESRPSSSGSRPGSAESRRPVSRGRDSGNIKTGKEVRATFVEDGKFGITFGSVPNSNPGPMKINKIDPSGLAAAQPQLAPGLVLIAVQGRSLQGKSREEASSIMKNTPRPITMTFIEADLPDVQKATPAAAAASVSKPAPAAVQAAVQPPAPAAVHALTPATESEPEPEPSAPSRADGLSDVESWYRWLGVDPKHDPNAVVVYAQEAAKQLAPRPWVLRNGVYINEETGDKQDMHPLVDTLKPRVESLRAVTSSTISDRSDNELSIGGKKSRDMPSSPSKPHALTPELAPAQASASSAPASAPQPATSSVARTPAVAEASYFTGGVQPYQSSTQPYTGAEDELRRRVTQLEADLRAAHIARSTAEQDWFDERRTLTDQLEHATLRAQVQHSQSGGNEDVQKLIAEKQIFIEKSHAEKRRYEELRARYDAMQSEHQDEIERLNDQHRKELATARAGKNELVHKLAAAEAAASGEGSMLQEVTSKIQAALTKLQSEATGNRAVEEQITAAVKDIRQDMKARRELEARALGEDNSRTSLVLSSLDLKMQEMQAHQAEMQRRQAEEAVRLQAERRRLDVLQESMAQERKLSLDTFNAELRDIQADRDKHLREHENANRALLEERRRLNMERESAMAETAAKERELTDIARQQAEKASQLASEQSALTYERKMAERESEEREREQEALGREKVQVAADRAQIEAYSAKLNELGRELQRRSAELADKQAKYEHDALAASRALAEAKEIEQRAEKMSSTALQKEQATAAQSLSVNRERLQLATEQRDITELRQEAERQAAEAKDRSRQLEQEIAKLQRQLAGSTSSRAREGKRRSGKTVQRSWTRMANKENDDARPQKFGSAGSLRRSMPTGGAGLSWEDDHARTQQLLREQARFMQQLKERPTERNRHRTEPEPSSPEPQRRSYDSWASRENCGVNRSLDYDDRQQQLEHEHEHEHGRQHEPLQHTATVDALMSEQGGDARDNHADTNSAQQDPASDPSSNDSTVYSFPRMVEVDVSTSSVISDRGGSAAVASGMSDISSALVDVGTASPGEALRVASLEAAQ